MTEEQVHRLLEIQKRDGVMTPRAVVEDAKDPTSPLHSEFDWDLERSAQAYWEVRARSLIQSVRVVQSQEVESVRSIRYEGPVFVRDPDLPSGQQGYLPVDLIRLDPDKAHRVLVAEFKRIASLIERARELAEVLGRKDDMRELVSSFQIVRQRFDPPEARQ